MIYYSDSKFEPYQSERDLRHKLMYYLNPCLKFMLNFHGRQRFIQYGYNSCRQTAVFGAAFCKFEFQNDCDVDCYEADFDDIVNNQPVQYTHAYFKLSIGFHNWLVDLSRTSRPLLFTEFIPRYVYPTDCPDYANVKVKNIRVLPWQSMILEKEPEWITGVPPVKLFQEVCQMVTDMQYMPPKERRELVDLVYKSFTGLQLERNEFC